MDGHGELVRLQLSRAVEPEPIEDQIETTLIPVLEAEAREETLAVEIDALKKMLRDQQRATVQAVNTASDLTTQLKATKAEAEKTKIQVHGGQKARIDRAEATVAQLKAQWHVAQHDLEKERRARQTEAIAAAAKVTRLQRELLEAVVVPVTTRTRWHIDWRRGATLVGVLALLVLMVALFHKKGADFPVRQPADATQPAEVLAPPVDSHARAIAKRVSVTAPRELSAGERANFSLALGRLNEALEAYPGVEPVEVLRQVYLAGNASVCSFEWNEGNPSLVFGGKETGSLAQSVARCADAVARFH